MSFGAKIEKNEKKEKEASARPEEVHEVR